MDHPAITTSGLTRKFGNLTAVNALNLDVPQGSIYGFLGPNGAGKTTTIRLLLGLIRLHGGHIQMFGRPFPKEKGITVFLSSHLLSEVEQMATHIGVINKEQKENS